jgi:ATP-binding cassette subfamily B protein
LSSIVGAHEILVMDRARIIERGTHEELLRRKGIYARLWLLQQRMERQDMMQSTVPLG